MKYKPSHVLLILLLVLTLSKLGMAQHIPAEAREHYERGTLLAKKDRVKALQELRRAIELQENFVEAHHTFQDLVLEGSRQEREHLLDEYRVRASTHPESPIFHYLLGRLLKGVESERQFRRSVELDPNFFWAHFALSNYYHNVTREFKQAEVEARRAVQADPKSHFARKELAHILAHHSGEIDLALTEIEKAKTMSQDPAAIKELERAGHEISGIRVFNLIAFFSYLIAMSIAAAFAGRFIKAYYTKEGRPCPADTMSSVLILYATVWFCLMLISTAKGSSFGTHGAGGFTGLLILLSLAYWPAISYHADFAEKSEKLRLHRFYKGMLAYFYLSGTALAFVFIYSVFGTRWLFNFAAAELQGYGMQAFLCNFVLFGLLTLIMNVNLNRAQKRLVEDHETKAHRRWEMYALLLFLLIFLPLVISSFFKMIPVGRYFVLVSTLTPLPFIIIGSYYHARYAFLDVFIKKTTVIMVTVLATVVYYIFVVENVAQNAMWKQVKYPSLLLLLPWIVEIPFLARAIESFVDRRIFKRRFTASEALSNFGRSIRLIHEEAGLLSAAKEHFSSIFSTKNVHVFFGEGRTEQCPPIPQPLLTDNFRKTKSPVLASEIRQSEMKGYCTKNEIEVAVPIIVEEKMRGWITLGKRGNREPYLSEDVRLLNSLADQLEFALENVELARVRREQELKEEELKVLASKAELRALRAQVNPHFLFNALNTIASLIKKDPCKAEEMVELLADFFRYTLAKSGMDLIPLAEEIRFINAYLEIEKARFGSKLQVHVNVDPRVEETRVPCMILQPLVENAVKHGIASKCEGGRIDISARRENGFVNLQIKDDGIGFDLSKSSRLFNGGVGLQNVRDRLAVIYGRNDFLSVESKPNDGTTVCIKIPA